MRIFATGKSGYIGRNLPDYVEPLPFQLTKGGSYEIGNLDLEGACVIHLAGATNHKTERWPGQSRDLNVTFSSDLAYSLSEQRVSKFIFASTSHVYGSSADSSSEENQPRPQTEYGRQKLAAEFAIRNTLANTSTQFVSARIFSILDQGMPESTLGAKLDKAMETNLETEVENSADMRDFMRVADVATALVKLAKLEVGHDTYNVSSGRPESVKNASLRYLRDFYPGRSVDHISFETTNSEMYSLWAIPRRLQELLNST